MTRVRSVNTGKLALGDRRAILDFERFMLAHPIVGQQIRHGWRPYCISGWPAPPIGYDDVPLTEWTFPAHDDKPRNPGPGILNALQFSFEKSYPTHEQAFRHFLQKMAQQLEEERRLGYGTIKP